MCFLVKTVFGEEIFTNTIVDSHVGIRNNTDRSYVHFTQFPLIVTFLEKLWYDITTRMLTLMQPTYFLQIFQFHLYSYIYKYVFSSFQF